MLYSTFSSRKACCSKDWDDQEERAYREVGAAPKKFPAFETHLWGHQFPTTGDAVAEALSHLEQPHKRREFPLATVTSHCCQKQVGVPLKMVKSALKAIRLPTSRLDWQPGRGRNPAHYHCSAQCVLYDRHYPIFTAAAPILGNSMEVSKNGSLSSSPQSDQRYP